MSEDLDLIYNHLFLRKEQNRPISVFISGVNHVGASWCALTLAHALSLENGKTLLVDGNGFFSNISTYINLNHSLYLNEYIKGRKTLNQLISAYKTNNFNILVAQSGSDYLEEQPIGRIQIFSQDIAVLSQNYDHTVIDIGTSISEQNFSLCQMADNILIICSNNSFDLVNTLETIRFIKRMNVAAKCYLIINKVDSFAEGYKIYKEFHMALERNGIDIPKLLGTIRFDTRIRDTIRNKELLLSRYPSSEAAIDIKNIAIKLNSENLYEK